MATDFDTKLRFLAKQIAWIIVFVLMSPFCLWGIYTGMQYMSDACVDATSFGIALDWWLIIVSVYDLVFAVVVMILLCCHTPGSVRRWIIWPIHAVNMVWMALGIALIVESDIRCQHNTLWVASIVNVSLTGTVAIVLFTVWILNCLGLCRRLGKFISLEEPPYEMYNALQVAQTV